METLVVELTHKNALQLLKDLEAMDKDRFGNPLTIKLTGPVEAYFHTAAESDEGADGAE